MRFEVLERGSKIGNRKLLGIALHEGFSARDLDPLPSSLALLANMVMPRERFKAKRGKMLIVPLADGGMQCIVIVGLGGKDDITPDDYRKAAYDIVRQAAQRGASTVSIAIPGASEPQASRCIGEGAALAGYRFDRYQTSEDDDHFAVPDVVSVLEGDLDALLEGQVLANAQCYARDIANEPGNVINPETLENKASDLAAEKGFTCTVLQADELERRGMNALLSVGNGSATPPRLIHLTYDPGAKAKGCVAIVGKGITFDSGGLSLKPADSMITMKGDKTGACVVFGVMKAAAELELPVKLHAIVGAAENMPDGGSYRPDDIIRASNGKTIEIGNTDAEGRLTLADALVYACRQKPDYLIDIATLTGACAVALGDTTAGLFSNRDEMAEAFYKTSLITGESFWHMPMKDENLRKKIKSPVADMINSTGTRYGGAITAAMFLENFVDKNIPWIHLDIAATDFVKEPYSYYVKGATAYGMRTIASFIIEKLRENQG